MNHWKETLIFVAQAKQNVTSFLLLVSHMFRGILLVSLFKPIRPSLAFNQSQNLVIHTNSSIYYDRFTILNPINRIYTIHSVEYCIFIQGTLTPPDTLSCHTLGFACVLMSRPISLELVLFPDFWVSNIPRYFLFCFISTPLSNRILWEMENWSQEIKIQKIEWNQRNLQR